MGVDYETIKEAAGAILPGRELHRHQIATCDALLSGQSVLLVSPTGSGKSLCYQLPTLISKRPTLVVSPLIALMDDQFQKARALGFSAGLLHNGIDPFRQWSYMAGWAAGKIQILLTSPERLSDQRLMRCLSSHQPGLLVIDEAHCISTWGKSFRPAYRSFTESFRRFGDMAVLAMTASASPRVREDIVAALGMNNVLEIAVPFAFRKLKISTIEVKSAENGIEHVLALLSSGVNRPMVIFCSAKRICRFVKESLEKTGHRALEYHAGLSITERSRTSSEFIRSKDGVLVATSAFEMGIDKTDIRTVVHFGLPRSLESYVQSIGRAGRDGLPAEAILLSAILDAKAIELKLAYRSNQSGFCPSPVEDFRAVIDFATTTKCREQFLNQQFFPNLAERHGTCGHCDRCQVIGFGAQDGIHSKRRQIEKSLKVWRHQKSAELNRPAFSVLTNREISRLSILLSQLDCPISEIAGIRKSAIQMFGTEIMRVYEEIFGRAKKD